jgi:hypothetical protein
VSNLIAEPIPIRIQIAGLELWAMGVANDVRVAQLKVQISRPESKAHRFLSGSICTELLPRGGCWYSFSYSYITDDTTRYGRFSLVSIAMIVATLIGGLLRMTIRT